MSFVQGKSKKENQTSRKNTDDLTSAPLALILKVWSLKNHPFGILLASFVKEAAHSCL